MAAVFSKILCPIDFEHDSMDALGLACQLAKQNSATVYLLTVIGAPPPAAAALPPVALNPNPEFEAACIRRLEVIAREKLAGASHEIFVATGNAAPEILNLTAAQGIDLIVMGTHGRTGLKHFLLGSVAEHVVRQSPVPVLTIHPKAAG
ncbi:MAG: universal stress protein [Candidatus Binatus sp.]|jgi:nucleotide-binding universal stress UspA family protein|uniref:universal stress protein n=1 Tax=Candidatus Binatus sp. TaxID=2811406 RepID=UPI003D0C6A65